MKGVAQWCMNSLIMSEFAISSSSIVVVVVLKFKVYILRGNL